MSHRFWRKPILLTIVRQSTTIDTPPRDDYLRSLGAPARSCVQQVGDTVFFFCVMILFFSLFYYDLRADGSRAAATGNNAITIKLPRGKKKTNKKTPKKKKKCLMSPTIIELLPPAKRFLSRFSRRFYRDNLFVPLPAKNVETHYGRVVVTRRAKLGTERIAADRSSPPLLRSNEPYTFIHHKRYSTFTRLDRIL